MTIREDDFFSGNGVELLMQGRLDKNQEVFAFMNIKLS
jgi:hypothetical protein